MDDFGTFRLAHLKEWTQLAEGADQKGRGSPSKAKGRAGKEGRIVTDSWVRQSEVKGRQGTVG